MYVYYDDHKFYDYCAVLALRASANCWTFLYDNCYVKGTFALSGLCANDDCLCGS